MNLQIICHRLYKDRNTKHECLKFLLFFYVSFGWNPHQFIIFLSVILYRKSTYFYGSYAGTCIPLHLQERFPIGWEYSGVSYIICTNLKWTFQLTFGYLLFEPFSFSCHIYGGEFVTFISYCVFISCVIYFDLAYTKTDAPRSIRLWICREVS